MMWGPGTKVRNFCVRTQDLGINLTASSNIILPLGGVSISRRGKCDGPPRTLIHWSRTAMLIANKHASHTDYPNELKTILSVESAEQSRAWLKNWKLLSSSATPLWDLPDAAARLGVARLSIKDESVRSPLGSFKALGAPIALVRLILR